VHDDDAGSHRLGRAERGAAPGEWQVAERRYLSETSMAQLRRLEVAAAKPAPKRRRLAG
jgi:hypothetical protein